jgi:hypothetical protein
MKAKISRAESNFVTLLKEVSKKYSAQAIAIQCLVPSAKVEAWLRGDLPPKSIMPVLNIALRHMQQMQRYHEGATKEAEESD